MKVLVKGKVKIVKLGLPLNKALNRAGNLIDRTTARSMQLIISGKTTLKDIKKPNIIRKFRTKKTKRTLELVEKRKFGIDTQGEKKGLSIAKALKPKIKRKTNKKVKVFKKKKKSSKIKRKSQKTTNKIKRKL